MDIIKPFMLEDGFFRGHLIAADDAVRDLWQKHGYPEALKNIFAEAVTVALALSAGIKYDGVFSLQIKGDGPVSSLFVDVTADKKVRGYLVFDEKTLPTKKTLSALFGNGRLIFSVATVGQAPYQGVVALTKETLAEAVTDYFTLSEQIDTSLVLRCKKGKARCLMIQKMPDKVGLTPEQAADMKETIGVLAESVRDEELFSDTLSPDEVLFRLFHANKLVVFPAKTPRFECRCYRGKMKDFLQKMTNRERQNLYRDGKIDVVCQFCGEVYSFTPDEFGDKK